MADFKLSGGPWNEVLSGTLQGHEIEVWGSNEELFLSMVYELQGHKRTGVLMEAFKVFRIQGEMERFVETLQRKSLGLIVHGDKNEKYLLVSTAPNYVQYNPESVNREITQAVQSVNEISGTLKDVGHAYDVVLKELSECTAEEKELFYSTPLVNLLFAPRQVIKVEKSEFGKSVSGNEVELGITKEGNSVKEPLVLFKHTLVSAGTKNQRGHVVRVLTENALLARVPVIAFVFENELFGLGLPSSETKKLKNYRIELEPIGFPIKEFELVRDLHIDISKVNVQGFMDVFGVVDEKLRTAFATIVQQGTVKTFEEVIQRAEHMQVTEQFTGFQKERLVRILKLIQQIHPNAFDGVNDLGDIVTSSHKTMGRASIINLRGKDNRKNILVIESVLQGLLEYVNENKKTELSAMIVLPNAEQILAREHVSATLDSISNVLEKLSNQGVGCILEANRAEEVNDRVLKWITAQVNVVKENDTAIQITGKKGYRCFIRPSLSKETEKLVELIEV